MAASQKVLDDILNSEDGSGKFHQELEDVVLEPLLDELDQIKNEIVRSFVRSLLLKAEVFWFIPASFSAEHHPPDERDEGGNVLHTKRVFRICSLLAESNGLDEEERDILLAAALLHDLTKGVKWTPDGDPSYDPFHPYTVDKFVEKARLTDQAYGGESQSSTLYLSEETSQLILRLVRCHMGQWSPIPETYPVTTFDVLLHLADYLASQLHWIIDGDDEKGWRWQVPE